MLRDTADIAVLVDDYEWPAALYVLTSSATIPTETHHRN